MADPVFCSKLSTDFESFITQKRAAGYPYITSAKVLGYLDVMIAEKFPNSEALSKEICDAWIEACSRLHQNTLLTPIPGNSIVYTFGLIPQLGDIDVGFSSN